MNFATSSLVTKMDLVGKLTCRDHLSYPLEPTSCCTTICKHTFANVQPVASTTSVDQPVGKFLYRFICDMMDLRPK